MRNAIRQSRRFCMDQREHDRIMKIAAAMTPVVIEADDEGEGIEKEHQFISNLYGIRGVDYVLLLQCLTIINDCNCDVMQIRLSSGEERILCFNIESFFGK